MAKSNQPFKRPSLSESEEFAKIPPPTGQESKFNAQAYGQQPVNPAVAGMNPQQQAQGPVPPTQEEIQWAVQIEEKVQKAGYKPNDTEMARYQDIANRIMIFQQIQAQRQAQQQAAMAAVAAPPPQKKKKSKLWLFMKLMALTALVVLFWAKAALVILQPSYLIPKGKIYVLVKPELFSKMYYSINMDTVYEDKIKKGFKKEELNLEANKKSQKANPLWYTDPQYWENNFIVAFPYLKAEDFDIKF